MNAAPAVPLSVTCALPCGPSAGDGGVPCVIKSPSDRLSASWRPWTPQHWGLHKLNRASAVSQFVGGDLIHRNSPACISSTFRIFSATWMKNWFCAEWAESQRPVPRFSRPQKDRGDRTHVWFSPARRDLPSAGFPDVAVVGILEDGIPWECRTAARKLSGTRTAVNSVSCAYPRWRAHHRHPAGAFSAGFTCDRPDLFKRSPVNRHAVRKKWPETRNYRNGGRNIWIFPAGHCSGQPGGTGGAGMAGNPRTEPDPEITPDNSYRNYLY